MSIPRRPHCQADIGTVSYRELYGGFQGSKSEMLQKIIGLSVLFLLAGCWGRVTPGSTGFCPNSPGSSSAPPPTGPPLAGYLSGDRDFWGHGPDIDIDVQACISADGNTCVAAGDAGTRVIALIDFDARETNADGTSAGDGTRIWQRFVHPIFPPSALAVATAPILTIDSPTTSTISVRSPAAGFEVWFFGQCNDGALIDPASISISGGLVDSIALIGDTGADDVSADPDCSCDTRINNMAFNPVEFNFLELEWRDGDWGPCIDGSRSRPPICFDSVSETVVADALCEEFAGSRPPTTSEPCAGELCGGAPTASSCTWVYPDDGFDRGVVATCLFNDDPLAVVDCRPSWCESSPSGESIVRWCACDDLTGDPGPDRYTIIDPPPPPSPEHVNFQQACSTRGCGAETGPLFTDDGSRLVARSISGNACVSSP